LADGDHGVLGLCIPAPADKGDRLVGDDGAVPAREEQPAADRGAPPDAGAVVREDGGGGVGGDLLPLFGGELQEVADLVCCLWGGIRGGLLGVVC